MAISRTLYTTTYSIPQTGDDNWDVDLTNLFAQVAAALADISCEPAEDVIVPMASSVTLALTADGVIPATGAPLAEVYWVSGSGAAVTLNATKAIQNGHKRGQKLTLIGTHATNTVTIAHGSNTEQNGLVTLGDTDSITYIWDGSPGDDLWKEVCRSS